MTTPADTALELLRQYSALRRAPGAHPLELAQAREAAARWCARAGLDGADLLERIEIEAMLDETRPTEAELDRMQRVADAMLAEMTRNAPRLSSDAEVDALRLTDEELDALESEIEYHARRLGIG